MDLIRISQPPDITLTLFPHKELTYVPFDLGLSMDVPPPDECPRDSATKQRLRVAIRQAEAAA